MSEAMPPPFAPSKSDFLPDHLGLDWIDLRRGFAHGRFEIGKEHLAPNGYLHAAAVVALADTACGYGCIVSLPEGAANFTTAELKANFIGTAREGGDRLRGAFGARRANDAGVGCGSEKRGLRQDHRVVPLHPDRSL